MKKLLLTLSLIFCISSISYAGIVYQGAGYVYYERGTVNYSAGDFTASGSMTWTVEAGDVLTYDYVIIEKKMTVIFYIASSTVGGTLSSELRIKIPAGKTAVKYTRNSVMNIDNGTAITGTAYVAPGATIINVNHDIGAGGWSASTNNSYVMGQITFEIQ